MTDSLTTVAIGTQLLAPISALVALLFYREAISNRKWFGILLATGGAYLYRHDRRLGSFGCCAWPDRALGFILLGGVCCCYQIVVCERIQDAGVDIGDGAYPNCTDGNSVRGHCCLTPHCSELKHWMALLCLQS